MSGIIKEYKPIEIFCGTGGVGKTTLSTARAIELAQKKKRVLLITIDPSKRLKEILKLSDEDAGTVQKVVLEDVKFDAQLMSPSKTFEWIAKNSMASNITQNRILKILFRPYGGMNEIMAIAELQKHLDSGHYDTIVLDTPPGPHFLDFLKSCQKINAFFDNNFMSIFKVLGKKVDGAKDFGIVNLLVKTGINKLLSYLEKVTGKQFIDDFTDAILSFYQAKDAFIKALEIEGDLKRKTVSNWFLVTGLDQNKFTEGLQIHQGAKAFIHQDNYLILNKSTRKYLNGTQEKSLPNEVDNLVKSFIEREKLLTDKAKSETNNVLIFDDILCSSPTEQVLKLSKQWNEYGII